MATIEISPATSGISPGLESLFRGITEDLTEIELQNTVTAIKSSYKGSFEVQKDQDLYSCLILLEKQGHVTEQNLTLLDKFVAPKATKGEGIKQRIEEFKKLRQQELKPRLELKGREKDVEMILAKLTKAGGRPVVNLHGSSGVGKTTLAKEVCSGWQWKQVVVDLREVSDMEQVYFHLMLALGSPHTIITEEANPVIAKMQQLLNESSGDLLLLLDNVDQFAGGEDDSNFFSFLQRLLGSQAELKKATLKILLTSRNEFLDFPIVDNYEVKPLEDGISGELIGGGGVPTHKREELLEMCKGKPLLLNIVAAILKQETALPEDLLRTLDPLETQQPAAAPPEKREQQDRETFDFQKEGLDEKQYSCLRKMFFFLPSKQLKDAAVSMSLFCRTFSLDAAAVVLNLDPSEAVVQLEGLRNSNVLSVDLEAKELLYDIHPSIRKFLRSIGNSPAFSQAYQKANKTFCSLFIGRIKQISHLLDKEYITAFNRFDYDKSNFELALDISFKSDYLLIPKDHHESVMVFYVFEAMLDEKQRRSIFNSWASKVDQDGKEGSMICAEMRSRESLQVLNLEGWRKAKEVLQLADDSLSAVEDEYQTSELYSLTHSTYLYAEGEIYYRMGNIPRALESFQRSLKIMEELLHDHTSTARCINSIGNCYNKRNQFEQAMECYTRAYNMREQLSGSKKHFDMPLFRGQIGTVYEGQKNFPEAIKYFQEALELAEELNIAGILYKALFYRNIANSYSWMRNFEAAYKPARKAYEIRKDILGKHPQTARIAFQLGLICRDLEEFDEAEEYFTEAWTIEKSLDQGNHSEVRDRIVISLEDIILQEERKKIFKKDALEFYQRIWEEEKAFQGFEFSESNRAIIDILNKRVSGLGDRRLVQKYKEEALWFYEAAWNSPEMEQRTYLDRESFLQTLLRLCKMLSEKGKFDKYKKEALVFYENYWKDMKDKMELKDQRSILQTLCNLASEEKDETRAKKYKGLLESLQETEEDQKGTPQFLPSETTAPEHGDNQESDDSGDFEPPQQVQWHEEASKDEGNSLRKKVYE